MHHCNSSTWHRTSAQYVLFAGHPWLTPVILAPQKQEIRRIAVWSQPRQIVRETLSQKTPQKWTGGVA
jgi:hypothetical protein